MGHQPSYDELRKRLEHFEREGAECQAGTDAPQKERTSVQVLRDLAVVLTRDDSFDEKMQLVVQTIRDLFEVDTAFIALSDDTTAVVRVTNVSGNRTDGILALRLPFVKGFCTKATVPEEGVIVEECSASSGSASMVTPIIEAEGFSCGVSVPIQMQDWHLGMLYAFNRSERAICRSDQSALVLIGTLAAAEISRWRTEELLEATLGDLERLVDDRSRELSETNVKLKQEIEERKQVEAHLREREELLRIFVEHTPAAVAMCDLEMRYLAYSRRWAADYQLGDGNLIGKCHYDVFQTIPNHWKDQHQRCFMGEIIDGEEEPFRRVDGSVGWVRRKVHPWHRTDGTIGGLVMFTEVITQRKEAEIALQASEVKYRLLFENASDAIFIAQDGKITFPSPKVCELSGYSMDEINQLPLVQLVHPNDRESVMEHQIRRLTVAKSTPDQYSCRFITKDGTEILVGLSVVMITWEGSPATLNFARDITEQKRLEMQLQQAQRMEAIGTLAGGVAHDFNNLLMGIQGRASLMLLDLDESHPHFDHLKGIEKYVQNATDLSKQLLGYARGGRYEVKSTNLNELIEKSADLFARTRRELQIHRKFHPDPWTAEVDRSQIEQVLLNILVNAWQAMPGGGDLYIETRNATLSQPFTQPHGRNPGHYILISITDTGVGIDSAIQARIFEPFFTTKEMGRGSGLGLASAYGIVKNHGGMITVSSEKGVGATFSIYLPASTEDAVELVTHPPNELEKGAETLLLVDDEMFVIEVGQEMLRRLGYYVITASSGSEAIDVYTERGEVIDCVILDMIMPDMNGGDLYDRLAAMDPDVKVLLSSGYSINGSASEILGRGCNGFIQKPFDIKMLSAKIREILDSEIA